MTDRPVWLTVSGYLPGQVRQEAAPDAGRDRDRLVRAPAPAVDGDLVAALGEPRRQLPGERLEAAVRGRDAASADDRDAQAVRPPKVASSGESDREHHHLDPTPSSEDTGVPSSGGLGCGGGSRLSSSWRSGSGPWWCPWWHRRPPRRRAPWRQPCTTASSPSSWIVTMRRAAHPAARARTMSIRAGGKAGAIYSHVFNGFVFHGSAKAAQALKGNPNVLTVQPNRKVSITAESITPGISRIGADSPFVTDATKTVSPALARGFSDPGHRHRPQPPRPDSEYRHWAWQELHGHRSATGRARPWNPRRRHRRQPYEVTGSASSALRPMPASLPSRCSTTPAVATGAT